MYQQIIIDKPPVRVFNVPTLNKETDMETKHQPATPLPWESTTAGMAIYGLDAAKQRTDKVASTATGDSGLPIQKARANARYIDHAANAYPKLIEELHAQLDFARAQGNSKNARTLEVLLLDLGELA
jgi:hypothetical protein